MSEQTDDQPVIDGEFTVLDDGVDQRQDHDQPGDADGNPDDEEEELEELELAGKKVALPKSVKAELDKQTMLHSDYTRKTQELAEQRRAFDQEKQTQAEHSKAFQEEHAKLYTVREQLKYFDNADWAAVAQQDHQNGTQNLTLYRIEWDRLKGEAEKLESGIKAKADEQTQAQQREAAKLVEMRDAAMVQQFPKWAEEFPQIQDFAAKHLGVPAEMVAATTDPRLLKGLRYAKLGFEAEQRTKTATHRQAEQQVKPATTLTAPRQAAAPASDPASMRLSADAWAAKRNAELAEKARNARRR